MSFLVANQTGAAPLWVKGTYSFASFFCMACEYQIAAEEVAGR
jgi:hypothetical protein